jgi:hypothetical protein
MDFKDIIYIGVVAGVVIYALLMMTVIIWSIIENEDDFDLTDKEEK